jgi:hypothetical protein
MMKKPTTPPEVKLVKAKTLDIQVKAKPWRRAAAR